MNKSLLLVVVCLAVFTFNVDAQDRARKREAKRIARNIEHSVDEMAFVVEQFDWSTLGSILSNTIDALDKNTLLLSEIVKNIDTEKIDAAAERIASKIEKSVDTEKIEKQLEQLGKRLQQNADKE